MRPPCIDEEFREAFRDYFEALEMVFHHDWEYTQLCIQNPDALIAQGGTFLRPNVEVEGSNWANRGTYLAAYRRLKTLLQDNGIDLTPKCGPPME
jgi:hypothetical protein